LSELGFAVTAVRVEPYAAVPTLIFRLRIAETAGVEIHTIALRCQVQIEPRRRHYSAAEQERLLDLFGEPRRWGETLQTLLWSHVTLMVPGFSGEVTTDLPLTCTYDFDLTAAKYFQALGEGEIPLLFLFSGTVFVRQEGGFSIEQVPWSHEAPFRLPVAVWRELMDRYFPGTVWLRLRRESFDALQRFKAVRALTSWEETIDTLLRAAAPPQGHGQELLQ
jgi:hypothetical protein